MHRFITDTSRYHQQISQFYSALSAQDYSTNTLGHVISHLLPVILCGEDIYLFQNHETFAPLIGFDRFLKVRSIVWRKVFDTFLQSHFWKIIKNLEKNQSYIDCFHNCKPQEAKIQTYFHNSFFNTTKNQCRYIYMQITSHLNNMLIISGRPKPCKKERKGMSKRLA